MIRAGREQDGLEIEDLDAGLGDALEEGRERGHLAGLESADEGLGIDRGLRRNGDEEEADAALLQQGVEFDDAGHGIGLVGRDAFPRLLPESSRGEMFHLAGREVPLHVIPAHGRCGTHFRGGGFGEQRGAVLGDEG